MKTITFTVSLPESEKDGDPKVLIDGFQGNKLDDVITAAGHVVGASYINCILKTANDRQKRNKFKVAYTKFITRQIKDSTFKASS